MKNSVAAVKSNQRLAGGIYEMRLQVPAGKEAKSPATAGVRPGQFINIKLDGHYLRRPISICDWQDDELTIIYKVVGAGTEDMSEMKAGSELDILWPLGNGFHADGSAGKRGAFRYPVLLGGGAGVPPMYGLCKSLLAEGHNPSVILGFRSAGDVFYRDAFEALGVETILTTEDGSAGRKGFVTDVLTELCGGNGRDGQQGGMRGRKDRGGSPDMLYACGPQAMLRVIDSTAPKAIRGQFSFEERMGCGFGACMGCSCKTKSGNKRICREGPVLERSEIIW